MSGRRLVMLALALASLAACAPRSVPPYGPAPLVRTVRAALANEPGRDFYRDRERLAAMGPELDPILLGLALDTRQGPLTRSNAVMLLADRGVEAAIPSLRIILLADEDDAVRAAAVSALYRFSEDPGAQNALRAAVGDRARRVRLGALLGLDIHDTATLWTVLRHERDGEVRAIAAELTAMAEARGAALQEGPEGLATVEIAGEPRLIFREREAPPAAGTRRGDLWVDLRRGEPRYLVGGMEAVLNVVPAFFSPDRVHVVLERGREIWVVPVEGGQPRHVSIGVAPRPVPFSDHFVFLRERPQDRLESALAWQLTYEVWQGSFSDPELVLLGHLEAHARLDRAGGASPVRWMRIRDVPEGFLLVGEGMRPFALPHTLVVVPSSD
jgi:hypothetical protein